jgi:hypothetical protein
MLHLLVVSAFGYLDRGADHERPELRDAIHPIDRAGRLARQVD